MSTPDTWVPESQHRSILDGLCLLRELVGVDDAHHGHRAPCAREEPTAEVVAVANVAQLLAIELAVATGGTVAGVLARLEATVDELQHGRPH